MTIEVSGVSKIISQLEAYKKLVDAKLQNSFVTIGERGVNSARTLYSSAIVDDNLTPREGEHFNLSYETFKDGVDIISEGDEVGFIEFGAGITYPDTHPVPHPPRGSYGQGLGSRRGWVYSGSEGGIEVRPGKRLTHGSPSNKTMYNESTVLGQFIVRNAIVEEFQK